MEVYLNSKSLLKKAGNKKNPHTKIVASMSEAVKNELNVAPAPFTLKICLDPPIACCPHFLSPPLPCNPDTPCTASAQIPSQP